MVKFGYKLMTEEHGPTALVANAQRAEQAGFDFVSISDHFHPWLESQGHAPFAWSVLGAIAHATSRIGITTGLTCPIIRYLPAIVAQAAATISVMSDDRFSLALGAGERLNEHVTGARWPSIPERHEMLREAIEICRQLWEGAVCNYEGAHFIVDHARIYDLPARPIPIILGISGPASVALAAANADGIMSTSAEPDLIDDFISRGGEGPRYGEVSLAYAASDEEGLALARDRFRFSAFDWSVNSELPTVEGFETASEFIKPEDLKDKISAGPDAAVHLEAIRKYVDAGFDHIVLTGIGSDQDRFIDFFERELRPKVAELA
jgi:G6PDH family F420-dependent oxidoreductase